ncbi:IclR family transcriptional regulator [Haloferax sulfurifontis]|uniref:IclR family transcriptional regulator n=1 Tax=Haloferax sulfurifontis TaxID=255616 RepID=A0A830E9K7_9EURY|nr:IclR family transcriptional regulator [Haloferax sulfurifontis]GGC68503.1 IclR family transcriptional regulator [Haloferax sulfurifontis]
MPTADDYGIKATMTSHRILDTIRSRDRPTLTEIARALDLSKPAVHKHLATLETLGYVMRRDGGYEIGLELVSFGVYARRRQRIYEVARPQVVELANSMREQVCLVVPGQGSEWNCLYVFTAVPADVDTPDQEGERRPLHATAAGKVILANMDKDEVAEFLDHDSLSSETANTITERNELKSKLQAIRDQGVAYDRQEQSDDYRGVAAPVLDDDGRPLGAIEVLGPPPRMSGKRLEEDTVGLVVSGARNVENKLSID